MKRQCLIWDEWNIVHIARHGVTRWEVEESLEDPLHVSIETHKERDLITGRAGVRLITVILAQEYNSKFYVVTARVASKKERRRYYGHI